MEAEAYSEQPSAIGINQDSRDFLENTAKWGKLLALVGFIFAGIIITGGLIGFAISTRTQVSGLDGALLSGALVSVSYLALGLLYFFPVLYLYKFSSNMLVGLKHNNQQGVTYAFKNLKSFFKLLGVLTIIMLVLITLGLLVMSKVANLGPSH